MKARQHQCEEASGRVGKEIMKPEIRVEDTIEEVPMIETWVPSVDRD